MVNNSDKIKKVKDYIYSLYTEGLITFEQYVHKLRLIEEEKELDVNEVSVHICLLKHFLIITHTV